MSKTGWKIARISLSVAAWLLLVWLLVRALGSLPPLSAWSEFNTRGTVAAAGIFAVGFTLATLARTLRFGLLTRLSAPIAWRDIALGFPWLFMLGAITPFRLGEGMRALWVRNHGGASAEAVGLWFWERFSDLLMLGLLFVCGLLLAPAASDLAGGLLVFVLAGALGGYLVLWRFHADLARIAISISPRLQSVAGLLLAFRHISDVRLHTAIIGLTMLIWLIMAGTFWASLSLMLSGVHPGMALAALGAVNLAAFLSASPGNVGSFQAAMVGVMLLYGHQAQEAFIASVIIQTVGLAVTCGLGLGARVCAGLLHRHASPPA